jgi:UDPglucose--hexose-1-phosphate uridylyltransferase
MAKYVPDIKTQRWVIISGARSKRPNDGKKGDGISAPPQDETSAGEVKKHVCPFCEGNESMTPPEVYRIGTGGSNEKGWDVRVVPNLYPITDIHEVIIHSPSESEDVENMPLSHVTKIFTAYRDRYRAHQENGQVMLFCNHGLGAGASLKHPHSQLVVVPNQINLDAVEMEPINNIVEENENFVTYCPDFSQWPFEVWIAPKIHGKRFGDVSDTELPFLAEVVQKALNRIEGVLRDPVNAAFQRDEQFLYNYYIYHGKNWFFRIIPRAIHRAGFELGTGLSVNIIDPTLAAEWLKKGTEENR